MPQNQPERIDPARLVLVIGGLYEAQVGTKLLSIGKPWTKEHGWHPLVPEGAQMEMFPI